MSGANVSSLIKQHTLLNKPIHLPMSTSPSFRLLILSVLILSGCAPRIAVIPSTDNLALDSWRQHQAQVANIDSWELKGKIGVKTANKGGTATLKWTYSYADQYIELYGPFGGGRVVITAKPGKATLKDTKGKSIEGETPQDVLYQRLGWQVPFDRLVMWSRGLPNPDATDLEFDSRGYVQAMNEDIWHVEYQEYQIADTANASHTLPRKLTITALPGAIEIYDDEDNYLGDHLSVKVILKKWWDIKSNAD
ncbi:MAG: outer membrane lipoprotein LolB [Gammaproteobacteria bacterium]|nr:outer membrane lipoprotein LolB [Gammaproteobacteria bacterium]